MEYWASPKWHALVYTRAGETVDFRLDTPVALIGSHSACNIFLDHEHRAPPIAYVAVAFEDSIEIWPLCPMAYPRWGPVLPSESFRVGKTKMVLSNDEVKAGQSVRTHKSKRSKTILIVESEGCQQPINLRSRVEILGEAHPSTIRVHGVDLGICDHAIIHLGNRCWFVNLRPKPNQKVSELVNCLEAGGPKLQMGNISISFPIPDPADDLSIESNSDVLTHNFLVDANNESVEATTLTSTVTEQLVSINQSRWSQRRAGKYVLVSLLFATAISTLAWIFFNNFFPLISSM